MKEVELYFPFYFTLVTYVIYFNFHYYSFTKALNTLFVLIATIFLTKYLIFYLISFYVNFSALGFTDTINLHKYSLRSLSLTFKVTETYEL